jgi:hypothetical protein
MVTHCASITVGKPYFYLTLQNTFSCCRKGAEGFFSEKEFRIQMIIVLRLYYLVSSVENLWFYIADMKSST